MEKLISELCQRTGIDRATAQKVASYLRENAARVPELVGGDGAKGVVGKIGDAIGRR